MYNLVFVVLFLFTGVKSLINPESMVDKKSDKYTRESQIAFAKFTGVCTIVLAIATAVISFMQNVPFINRTDSVLTSILIIDGTVVVLYIIVLLIASRVIMKKNEGYTKKDKSREDDEF